MTYLLGPVAFDAGSLGYVFMFETGRTQGASVPGMKLPAPGDGGLISFFLIFHIHLWVFSELFSRRF